MHKVSSIALLLVLGFGAGAAGADVTIDCPGVGAPVDRSWTEAPTTGRYMKSYIASNRGHKTLICRYVHNQVGYAIMRRPPKDNAACHPTETGFTCKPKFMLSRVMKRGVLSLEQSRQADLDTGTIGESKRNDLWFDFVMPSLAYLKPVNGARFGIYEGEKPLNKNECAKMKLTTGKIPVSTLKEGVELCMKSNSGQYSLLRMDQTASGPDTLSLAYTMWE